MNELLRHKVTAEHLRRDAYLYVRQSSLRQVLQNTESTRRQYALRERAFALGWHEEQLVVVDCDQGLSGALADRQGFQRLVTDVGLGKVGLVMGLEVSRLARNCVDRHRLLEICALSRTLILDEDGLYDPAHFNDRLLLGLKGTMSEAELYAIRARLQGGLLNKARRGELRIPLPIGFLYDERSRVVLDPDLQVREAIHLFFRTFRRVGSALGAAKAMREQKLSFPSRRYGSTQEPLVWKPMDFSTALRILTNPRYAGVYCYGRTRYLRGHDGKATQRARPFEEWVAWFPDAHEGYISLDEHEENLRRLKENARAVGAHRRRPAREGSALLQGMVMCGKCGRPMTVHYHKRKDRKVASYVCGTKEERGCWTLHGDAIHDALNDLVVEIVSPLSLEVCFSVQEEIQRRIDETERLRRRQVERARYEADLARRRFMQVDPDNRLVALSLEADWNEKLQMLHDEQASFERQTEKDRQILGERQKAEISALSQDFPKLWKDPATPDRERKRMLRLLLEDATLERDGNRTVCHLRFKGGANRTLSVPAPKTPAEQRRVRPEVLRAVDRLLDHHTAQGVADELNRLGFRLVGADEPFKAVNVEYLRRRYGLESRRARLEKRGYTLAHKLGPKLGVGRLTLLAWESAGLIDSDCYHGNRRLYKDPTFNSDQPIDQIRESLRRQFEADQKNNTQGAV